MGAEGVTFSTTPSAGPIKFNCTAVVGQALNYSRRGANCPLVVSPCPVLPPQLGEDSHRARFQRTCDQNLSILNIVAEP